MNRIYTINKVVVIINVLLVIIPFLGLAFLFITGCIQVISYSVCLLYWKRLDHSLRGYFKAYPFLVTIALCILALEKDVTFIISLSLSAFIGIGFVFLLKKQKELSEKIK